MNRSIISLVLIGILSVGYLTLAKENTKKSDLRGQKDQFQQDIKDAKAKAGAEIKDARIQLKNTAEAMKEDLKKRKEEFNDTIKAKQAELEDQIKTKKENLKTRLEKIKDENKKKTVERIDRQMDVLNEKMMKHFSNVLDKLEEMLIRISERADKAFAERGLDVSAVRLATEKAKIAIASARLAIEVQSGKTYTIKITTENVLKTNVGKARQSLGTDLAKVRDAVKAAQSAVKNAAVVLAQLVIKPKVSPSPSTACTQEAKLCPDGSSVGRTGPNCEFKACPGEPTQP